MSDALEINVGKRTVKTKFVKVPLVNLHFYPSNPRISSVLLNYHKGKLDDEFIHKLMNEKQGEATRTLYQTIKKDGIINEPLIVYNNKVLEGNTRLWVARQLSEDAKTNEEKKRWSVLPCRVVQEKLNAEEINYILCNVHIKKKKDWMPFEQACYVARMRNEERMKIAKIQEITGFAPNKIYDYIATYKEMKSHNAEPGDWNRYFEAYKDPDVKEVHKAGKYDVVETIMKKKAEGKMGTARDSRKLGKVLKSARATKMFFEGDASIERAFEVAVIDHPEEGDPLLKRVKYLGEDLANIPFDKLEEIKKDKAKINVIKELAEQLKKLCNDLKIRF